jgi:AcrR family transcriptional regulator
MTPVMSESPADPDPGTPLPPRPRKLPQQSRSQLLVASIKEACLKILRQKGPRALTVSEIAEVSGVAIGSIYQYFPNVDAIVATVYEDLIEQEVRTSIERLSATHRQVTLRDAMTALIEGTLALHRRMLTLDQDFHQRFYQAFSLIRWFNRLTGDPQAATRLVYDLLIAHRDEVPSRNPEMEAFVVTSALQAVVLEAVKLHPEYLESPDFTACLLDLTFAVLGRQP